MKKLFEDENYGQDITEQITEWIKETLYTKEGNIKTYRPRIIVEIFDNNGDEINSLNKD